MPSFTQYIVRYCLFSGKLGNLTMHVLNSMYIYKQIHVLSNEKQEVSAPNTWKFYFNIASSSFRVNLPHFYYVLDENICFFLLEPRGHSVVEVTIAWNFASFIFHASSVIKWK